MNDANTLLLRNGNESARPGCWRLAPAAALTVAPRQAGSLRVTEGRVWATLDGPHRGPANDWGDLVLRSGQALQLRPGQQIVLEAFGEVPDAPAAFRWEPEGGASGPGSYQTHVERAASCAAAPEAPGSANMHLLAAARAVRQGASWIGRRLSMRHGHGLPDLRTGHS